MVMQNEGVEICRIAIHPCFELREAKGHMAFSFRLLERRASDVDLRSYDATVYGSNPGIRPASQSLHSGHVTMPCPDSR